MYEKGTTADVNSLYPSMMSSESGNKYPIGKGCFWSGNYIPDKALKNYYFVRIKTRFYLKKNKLPFIQIKNNLLYKGTESLETSDVYDVKTDKYYRYYTDKDNNVHDTRVELTLTMTDFELIKEHYELVDFEILDGCWFYSMVGIFDEYIDKYKKIKTEEAFNRAYARLYEKQILPAKEKGLCAAIYTHLSDVESEINGLMTYDRRVLKADPELFSRLHRQLTEE